LGRSLEPAVTRVSDGRPFGHHLVPLPGVRASRAPLGGGNLVRKRFGAMTTVRPGPSLCSWGRARRPRRLRLRRVNDPRHGAISKMVSTTGGAPIGRLCTP
jgi:hypothetical protein